MIRPEFFTDAELADLPAATRLLFIGLWTLADREGRLKDKPRSIRMALLPSEDFDVDEALQQLVDVGSIRRYEVDGMRLIDIPGFVTYQHCHYREAPSELPAFKFSRAKKVAISREASGQPQASPILALGQPVASTSTSTLKNMGESKAQGTRKRSVYTAEFEQMWAAFPPKPHNNKKAAFRCWTTRLRAGEEPERMVAAARHYATSRAAKDPLFTMLASTFLGPDLRYEEYVDEQGGNGNGSHGGEAGHWRDDYDENGTRRPEWVADA